MILGLGVFLVKKVVYIYIEREWVPSTVIGTFAEDVQKVLTGINYMLL